MLPRSLYFFYFPFLFFFFIVAPPVSCDSTRLPSWPIPDGHTFFSRSSLVLPSTQPGLIIHCDRKLFFFLAFISDLWTNCDLVLPFPYHGHGFHTLVRMQHSFHHLLPRPKDATGQLPAAATRLTSRSTQPHLTGE
ncbi:hypothetical protein BDP55DRAFT_671692 [Colletotrichum godetiae]|uniref:Secreted protein n=1 Tax=Colletotrichum godetiae TaxID=1209918 RepID=A0AAJ0ET60_9PEZI|nr:uncharacterized protein BDP55DRAFT_671692 [Colletotrichum godetiae]KAK1673013.1 hypothetical protein BDP55DRAFT_671692 [Colletotrichum godetiae]